MTTGTASLQERVAERLALVQESVAAAARRAGHDPSEVTLVAVCKTVGREVVDAAYRAGQRDFGENRVQDALAKFSDAVPEDLRLHLIGSLQTNKAKQVVGRFELIHSLDRNSLADELDSRAQQSGTLQPVLIQVNVSREVQKHGCDIADVKPLIEHVLGKRNLQVRGFMTMAALTSTPEEARPVFNELREIAERLKSEYPEVKLTELSMGMTNDYSVAIEEGATIVRVGRAIFADDVIQ